MGYYQYSGKVPPAGLLLAFAVTNVAAVVCGFVYGYAIAYLPFIYLNAIICGIFGGLLGWTSGYVVRMGRVRNGMAAYGLAAYGALVGIYSSWIAWFLAQTSNEILVVNPGALFAAMSLVAEKGAWSIFGVTPTGIFLWLIWAIEAGVIGIASIVMVNHWSENGFCEDCGCWCKVDRAFGPYRCPENFDDFRTQLERRDGTVLASLVHDEQANPRCLISLSRCPKCQGTMTLRWTEKSVSVDSKGQEQEDSKIQFDLLLCEKDWPEQFPVASATE